MTKFRTESRRGSAILGLVAGVTVFLAACAPTNPSANSATTGNSSVPDPAHAAAAQGTCPPVSAVPPQGASAEAVVLSEGGNSAPRISAVAYPKPGYNAKLWSQWGQGVVLDDGRFLSAIGDHEGVDANSFLYVYEPDRGRLTRFGDVLSLVEHSAGSWGYGKIHAQMVQTSCDQVVFATYWGTRKGLTYAGSYAGDHLLAIDTRTLALESLGVPIPEHGIPSLAGFDGLIYGEAVDPWGRASDGDDVGEFFVFDPERREVVHRSADKRHTGFRSIAVDDTGRAFVAMGDKALLRYDPGGSLQVHPTSLPAGWLRAATRPDAEGTVYAVTTKPDQYVALRPDGGIANLGQASDYIASAALAADGREFFVAPGAHGTSWELRSPLVAVDVRTGQERVVAELGPLVQDRLGLVLGGSYNVAVDGRTGRIFVAFNAGPTTEDPWGDVVLLTVDP